MKMCVSDMKRIQMVWSVGRNRVSPIRHQYNSGVSPGPGAKAIVLLRQILLQQPNHLLCRAPGLLVSCGASGELIKEHDIKISDSPESVRMDN